MSKLNQIQQKLLALDGGAFQKLADSYLYKKGYKWVDSPGSVSGADKVRKGTPDSFTLLPNGKYVFSEYTTTDALDQKREKLYSKLESDLAKCFDAEKTGIPVEKIEKVVFCHTSVLSTEEESALAEKCQQRGVDLEIFGLARISQDLYQKYKGLARDFLGVEVDTGQIVPPDEFVANYNKNKLSTRLDTAFHFRETELEQVLQGLEANDLLLVSGGPGVGKSRLVLEACTRFQEIHPEYEVQCISNRGRDLFEDLRVHFAEPGNFLLFVDDASRISPFDYFIDLLQRQREDQRIKVIATVRDYALDKIRKAAEPHGGGIEIKIQPLENSQIRQLIEDEHGIHDPLYLDRIVAIAQGNPRIAIMAAEIAKREETLYSVSDVSALYDRYFESIREELEGIGDEDVVRVAAIVAFFRAVDRSSLEGMEAIERAFGLSQETFWTAARRLHEMEVFDLYEDEVVKISDQVLATYLFYLGFFRRHTLDFSSLLENFFPELRSRVVDVLHPVLSAFGFETIREQLRLPVERAWSRLTEAGDEQGLLDLLDVFWFVKPTDTLLYLRDQIQSMEVDTVEPSELKFASSSWLKHRSILSVLGSFGSADANNFEIALNLLFDYFTKRPQDLPQVLHLLGKQFGIDYSSAVLGLRSQRLVLDTLWNRTQEGIDEVFSRIFLATAKEYLLTDFEHLRYENRGTVAFQRFSLEPSPEVQGLREMIWSRAFALFRVPPLQTEVLKLIHDYSKSLYMSARDIIRSDSAILLRFIESELDPNNYIHAAAVQDYLNLLKRQKLPLPSELQNRFRNETLDLADLLGTEWPNKGSVGLDFEGYEQLRKQRIIEYSSDFTLAEYLQFFERCSEMLQKPSWISGADYKVRISIETALLALSQRDPDLYLEVLARYLDMKDPLTLNPDPLVDRLVMMCGAERAHKFLASRVCPGNRNWLFSFYKALPTEAINRERLDELYALYRESEQKEIPFHLDFLLIYQSTDAEVVATVTRIILERSAVDPGLATNLSLLFNPNTEVNKILPDLFSADLNVLEWAYLATLRVVPHHDFNRQALSRILDLDPGFILTYVDEIYSMAKEQPIRRNFHRDHSSLWLREDYEKRMTQAVERIYEREREHDLPGGIILKSFFEAKGSQGIPPEAEERQDHFLREIIRYRHKDIGLMVLLFGVISHFPTERICPLIALFLENNREFTDFERLPLTPSSWSVSGSHVPIYQGRADYLESLLPLLNSVDLLQHRQYIERKIQEMQGWVELEKKREFMKD